MYKRQTSAETVKKTEANKSAVEAAVAEIKADEAKPVVNQSDAKPGELVDVSKKVSPIDVKERQEGDQKIHEETATVEVTKTEVAPVKSEELPAPKTETTESTVSGKDEDGNSYTQYERVDVYKRQLLGYSLIIRSCGSILRCYRWSHGSSHVCQNRCV